MRRTEEAPVGRGLPDRTGAGIDQVGLGGPPRLRARRGELRLRGTGVGDPRLFDGKRSDV